ncbi:hypothetical protein HPP92_018262 [Vanilla planifolia]|uniref:Uncharacterized protein n=1 Tax=Vanilla planifolia TaxID=51239 RepID=A0A835QEF6_VANPL|nr:hypothetical protein HPP92_018878 [Vanilla planifolia]KAG0468934.1 hypothetical protein HPP92_018262 [Vanilla planifolia]
MSADATDEEEKQSSRKQSSRRKEAKKKAKVALRQSVRRFPEKTESNGEFSPASLTMNLHRSIQGNGRFFHLRLLVYDKQDQELVEPR